MRWEDYLQLVTAINAKTVSDQLKLFAKVYKLPNLELVGKYSDINLFGKTILEHYKDGDPQRNEEILSVTKKKIEDQAKSLASDICGSKTSW